MEKRGAKEGAKAPERAAGKTRSHRQHLPLLTPTPTRARSSRSGRHTSMASSLARRRRRPTGVTSTLRRPCLSRVPRWETRSASRLPRTRKAIRTPVASQWWKGVRLRKRLRKQRPRRRPDPEKQVMEMKKALIFFFFFFIFFFFFFCTMDGVGFSGNQIFLRLHIGNAAPCDVAVFKSKELRL